MPTSSYVFNTLRDTFFPQENVQAINSLSDLTTHLYGRLGPLSKRAQKVILVAFNDYTAIYNDPKNPLEALQHLVLVSNGDTLPVEELITLAMQHRDRSKEIVTKAISHDAAVGQTIYLGSISNRAYMTIIVTNIDRHFLQHNGTIHNELYAFNRVIQDSYELLQPFRAGALKSCIA